MHRTRSDASQKQPTTPPRYSSSLYTRKTREIRHCLRLHAGTARRIKAEVVTTPALTNTCQRVSPCGKRRAVGTSVPLPGHRVQRREAVRQGQARSGRRSTEALELEPALELAGEHLGQAGALSVGAGRSEQQAGAGGLPAASAVNASIEHSCWYASKAQPPTTASGDFRLVWTRPK